MKGVSRGLQAIVEQHNGQTVVLVAHGFVAKVIRAVTQADFDDFFEWQLGNGAVLELCITGALLPTDGTPRPLA